MGFLDWMRGIFGGAPASREEAEEESRVAAEIQKIKGAEAEVAGLNFQTAIEAHMKWRARLEAVINGTSAEKLDPAVVAKDDQCVLGKWIHGEGAAHSKLSGFAMLQTTHAQFHHQAATILRQAVAGHKDKARAEMSGEYRRTSVKIGGLLATMHHEASKALGRRPG